jgi:hypothetical protein
MVNLLKLPQLVWMLWSGENLLPLLEIELVTHCYTDCAVPAQHDWRCMVHLWAAGLRYAMLLMKTIVSTMIRHYKVTTSIKMADIQLKLDVLLKPVQGFPIVLEPRTCS